MTSGGHFRHYSKLFFLFFAVLTNANLLSCETCNFFNLCGSGDNNTNTSCFLLRTCGSSAYQGHYVLAVGFDIPKRKIYYRNPTLRDRGKYILKG